MRPSTPDTRPADPFDRLGCASTARAWTARGEMRGRVALGISSSSAARGAGGGAAGRAAGLRGRPARRAPSSGIELVAVMRLPFWVMLKRQGVLSPLRLDDRQAAGSRSGFTPPGTGRRSRWRCCRNPGHRSRNKTWSTDWLASPACDRTAPVAPAGRIGGHEFARHRRCGKRVARRNRRHCAVVPAGNRLPHARSREQDQQCSECADTHVCRP